LTKKVLIVDDHALMRQTLATILRGHYEVLFAANGMEGIGNVNDHPDVSLILLDVNMPMMNGMEMIDFLRNNHPEHAQIPILMVTTESDQKLIQKAKAKKVAGWLTKPIDAQKLLQFAKILTTPKT
jgi:CheY-like chemotaxis protein